VTQKSLFDVPTGLPATDPNCDARDMVRLAGQNAAILERLRTAAATNAELAGISLKYTSRISDLRKAGFTIRCVRGEGGANWYRLES